MSNKAGSRTKNLYGIAPKRSEYDDAILRDNQRTNNRHRRDMHYQDRAQKVIMKDLGKESLLLQSKLENDRKSLSLSLFGSKFGTQTVSPIRKYSSTSPTGKVLTSSSFRQTTQTPFSSRNSRNESKFPWDKEQTDKDSGMERSSVFSTNNASASMTKSNNKFRSQSDSAYMSSRGQTDDFLADILKEAMNDELLYTQGADMSFGQNKEETPRTGRASRRSRKTPRSRVRETPSDSIVNALANVDSPPPE